VNRAQTRAASRYWFPKLYADFVQRLRVASGFLLLIAFAWFSHPSIASLAAGLPISVCGLFLRGWAAGHLAKDRELATSGPYAYVRNPLYMGTVIVALGIVIACRSAWMALVFAAVFLLVYLPVVELEEQHLRDIFADYDGYALRVRRFLPGSPFRVSDRRFSWPLYRHNEEYKAGGGFLIAAAWLFWCCIGSR